MATYQYQSYFVYQSHKGPKSDKPFELSSAHDESGTISDSEADMTFEIGDVIRGDHLPANRTFEGSYKSNGVAHMVVRMNDNKWHVYSSDPLAKTSLPTVIDPDSDPNFSAAATVTCFLTGTLIATPTGERAVESLSIGDLVLTADGAARPVRWIGRQNVSTLFGAPERLRPVRISAGALGDGLPHTDLTVTADHAMLVCGVLVHAGALVNGTTITTVPLSEFGASYTVYNIETEVQELILANGAPAESFVDNVERASFDNYDEYLALYGKPTPIPELDLPRAMSPRQLPLALRRMLGLARAA